MHLHQIDRSHQDLQKVRKTGYINGLSRNWLSYYRVHLIIGLAIIAALPAILSPIVDLTEGRNNAINSSLASAAALLLASLAYSNSRQYSGHSSISLFLTTLIISHFFAIAIMFFFRIEYSRLVLISCFVTASIWFATAAAIARGQTSLMFAVLPFGPVERLQAIANDRLGFVFVEDARVSMNGCNGIIADTRCDLPEHWERYLMANTLQGVPVLSLKSFMEMVTGRVDIEHLSENSLASLNWKGYIGIRLVGEWLFAALSLIILFPLLCLVALAIKLDTRGPVFFLHDRIGYRGREFRTFKFRTMIDRNQTDLSNAVKRTDAMTVVDDPRITRVGKFLRKTRLDELPQIVNILRGEMSWIGPRPEAVPLSRWYEVEIPFYHYRHMLRPGITGWAQVSQGHVTAMEDVKTKLQYDFYYIKRASFWLDLYICFKTLQVVFSGKGAR